MTVRHYMAQNGYRLQEVQEKRWIVPAICGALFQPGDEILNHPRIEICPTCHMAQHRPQALRPHYVYRCFDETDSLLYVGCTNAPPRRLDGHKKTAWWWPQVSYTRNLVFPDRDVALARERAAIASEMPTCNVKGRWLKHVSRDHWTAENYLTFRKAIVQAVETTHGVYGTHTRRLLADVDQELSTRFGVSALGTGRSA